MKELVFVFLTTIILYSCSKEEPVKMETFSTDAFAYDVDLVTPAGDTIKALISRVEDKTDNERIMEISLEAQFELDSTYATGDYTIIFNIKDVLSDNIAVAPTTFKIENE